MIPGLKYDRLSFSIVVSSIILCSCSKPGSQSNPTPPPVLSSSKDITSFVFKAADNLSLQSDIIGTISVDSVKFQMYQTISLNNLIPTISLTGKTISPANHTSQNFSNIITYTVTAEDGTTKVYSVKAVHVDSSTLIQKHWRVVRDSVYDTPGFATNSGHPTPGLYIGTSSDYDDFTAV